MELKLIIVTGISASGKTQLSKELSGVLGGIILSVDDFKEQVYEEYGFLSEYECKIMNYLAKALFSKELILAMRNKCGTIIVEYPFDMSWQEFFTRSANMYGYRIIVVNCNTRSFEEIWASRVERDSDFDKRPMCLTARAYVRGSLYECAGKLNDKHKAEQKIVYETNERTSLVGDYVFTDKEIRKICNIER